MIALQILLWVVLIIGLIGVAVMFWIDCPEDFDNVDTVSVAVMSGIISCTGLLLLFFLFNARWYGFFDPEEELPI